jgi:hypothetical protein
VPRVRVERTCVLFGLRRGAAEYTQPARTIRARPYNAQKQAAKRKNESEDDVSLNVCRVLDA